MSFPHYTFYLHYFLAIFVTTLKRHLEDNTSQWHIVVLLSIRSWSLILKHSDVMPFQWEHNQNMLAYWCLLRTSSSHAYSESLHCSNSVQLRCNFGMSQFPHLWLLGRPVCLFVGAAGFCNEACILHEDLFVISVRPTGWIPAWWLRSGTRGCFGTNWLDASGFRLWASNMQLRWVVNYAWRENCVCTLSVQGLSDIAHCRNCVFRLFCHQKH